MGKSIFRVPQEAASKCRMGSLGASLDFPLTHFTMLAFGVSLLLSALMFAQVLCLLLQHLWEEEERVRTLHSRVSPTLSLFLGPLRGGVGQGAAVFGKDKIGG